ncbi:MAG: DnaJ domain-containing protein, partial [Myxococcota bacterium]
MSATLMDTPPRLATGVNFAGLNLTAADGFLLSRIDGATTADDLCHLVGQSPEEMTESLYNLERLGVLVWSGNPPPAPKPEGPPFPVRAEIEAELTDVDFDAIDIDYTTLASVLEMEARLKVDHWHALNLSGEPSRSVVKKAFFALSKKYHPDRFFGKDLGPYKQRLERVFTGLKGAYDVLSNNKKKKAYIDEHPAPSAAPYDFVPGLEPKSEGASESARASSSPRPDTSPRSVSQPRSTSGPRTTSSPRATSSPRSASQPRASTSPRPVSTPRDTTRPVSSPKTNTRPRTSPT